MTLASETWGRDEVAAHLGINPDQLSRKIKALEAHGFPQQIPCTRRWSPVAILIWEVERSLGRRLDGVAILEAAGIGANPARLLEARAASLMRTVK